MKKIITLRTGLLLAFILALTNIAAQTLGDFRTTAAITVNGFSNATGWQTYNGSNWVQAIYSPVGNYGSQAVKSTGSAISGSTTVTLTASNPLIRVNQYVTNAGVTLGTVVSAISGTTLTLSQPTTAAISAASLFFGEEFSVSNCRITNGQNTVTSANNPAIVVGMGVTGTGIPVGAIVTAVSGTSLTLSANATATSTTTALKFFTKETTATTTAGSTTITLKEPNSLVAVGMDVYSVTNGLIQNSATVTAINGAEITISIPVAVAYSGLPVQFAFFGTIPNLYINHSTSTVNNSKSYHIGNVFVNNASSTNAGIGAVYSDATLGIGGTTTSSTIFMCETLTLAPAATVKIATTTSNLTNTFFITNGVGGNAINNNGTIDLFTSPGTTSAKTNLFFSGAGATTISGTGAFRFNTFSLNRNTLNLTLAANATITGGTIVTGASLIVNEGKVLTNTGSFTNAAGNLILKSSATGTASLLSTSSIPNVTQQRYLSSNQRGWRLLSNPIATKTFNAVGTASGITLGTGFTGAYDPATNTWTSTDGTANMDTQKAYKVFITGLSGESPTYTTGPSNVTLVNKGTAANTAPTLITTVTNQYYLVGNPYTAPVSVASILAESTGLSNTVSYYDPTIASTDIKVKAGGYNSTTVSGAAGSATDVVIPPMGAIFVQATTDGSITIPKTVIFTGTPSQTGTYNHKTAQTKIASTNALKVEVSSGDVYYDAIALQFKAIGDAGSNIDFGKLPNTVLDAYSLAGSQKMAVSELELKEQTIPLGVTSTLQKNYSFKVVENTIPVGFEAVLIDNVLNTSTVLAPGTNYDFAINSTPASQGDARFAINLKAAGSLGIKANELEASIQVYPNPAHNQFNIFNGQDLNDGSSIIEISNVNGQVIHSQKSNPRTTTTIQTNGWAAGVYILKATNNETQTTKKLIIQ
jgi:trimeric autotransporter adhesin